MKPILAVVSLAALAACGSLPRQAPTGDDCGSNPNITSVTVEDQSGGRIQGNFCGSCNGGLLKVDLAADSSFQVQLDQGKTGAIPLPASGLCPSLYWKPGNAASGESATEHTYTDGLCGVAAPEGVSGTVNVTSAPGSGKCAGEISARLFRGRLSGKGEWATVALRFDVKE